jgi:DNA-binding transcriptional LysR family regulator
MPRSAASTCPRRRLDELVTTFLHRRPGITVRLVGRNSAWTAERVRRGDLEAAIIVLPIDDDRLDVRPLVRDEVRAVADELDRNR